MYRFDMKELLSLRDKLQPKIAIIPDIFVEVYVQNIATPERRCDTLSEQQKLQFLKVQNACVCFFTTKCA